MKVLSLVLLPLYLLSSCAKQDMVSPIQPPYIEKPVPIAGPLPIPWRPRPRVLCVESYSELVQYLGGASVNAKSVILENGTVIQVTGPIRSIIYSVSDQRDPNSLFRSQLSVTHTYYGTNQTHFTEAWSLGCTFQNVGNEPYTNIVKGSVLLKINTAFTWSVPPYNTQHLKVMLIEI
ncbi:hypothetical protein HB364_14065 [Pseudoflavitalea sp. X16]|uniref:hypothetical protein n=1 Tax=Paraflavitalea devenefica TaxID=2716334 RepID=UPI00141FAA72|nr:hypothetical protein [Paraflavitalea devenefica]NII26215.1 hypothetical protein [Paraflavitalea devenefica]